MIWGYPHDYNGNLPEPVHRLRDQPKGWLASARSPWMPRLPYVIMKQSVYGAFLSHGGYLQIDPNHPFCWDVPLETIHVGDPPFMETSIYIYIYISYIWCTFRYVSCIYLNRRIYVHTQPLWLWFRWWFFDVPIWWCCNLPWLGNPLSFTFIFFGGCTIYLPKTSDVLFPLLDYLWLPPI